MRDLRARGFAVAALDWRGQGLSDRALGDRRKSYVRDFSEYDSDLETFMREVVLPDCPPPIFALGHSTGASVLIRAAHRGHRWFDRMVLTAPLIKLGGVDYSHGAGPLIVRALRMAGFGTMYVPKTDTSLSSRGRFSATSSPRIRYAMPAMPRSSRRSRRLVGAPTVAWMDTAFRSMRAMREHAIRRESASRS